MGKRSWTTGNVHFRTGDPYTYRQPQELKHKSPKTRYDKAWLALIPLPWEDAQSVKRAEHVAMW